MAIAFRLFMVSMIFPVLLFSQAEPEPSSARPIRKQARIYPDDSTFSILFNVSNVFTTAKDPKINSWMKRYGYRPPENIPVGVRIELAAIPFNSKMMYSLAAGTVVSAQDLVSSNFTLGAYRRFIERKHFWILAGAGIGKHGDRIVLNGNLPPSFDSLAHQYNKVLSLHRGGFLIEPAVKFFWYPLQTKKFQLGLFAGAAYDLSFNTMWKLGYYNQNGQFTSFRRIHRSPNVQTQHEFGWAFSDGLSFCFKFD